MLERVCGEGGGEQGILRVGGGGVYARGGGGGRGGWWGERGAGGGEQDAAGPVWGRGVRGAVVGGVGWLVRGEQPVPPAKERVAALGRGPVGAG